MLADDVRRGLEARPRWLPPKYFYDHAGSVLFERITELPEYYLTRVEEVVIRDVAPEVMRRVRPREIVELGPGSCRKVRFLYDVIGGRNDGRYCPLAVGRGGDHRRARCPAGLQQEGPPGGEPGARRRFPAGSTPPPRFLSDGGEPYRDALNRNGPPASPTPAPRAGGGAGRG